MRLFCLSYSRSSKFVFLAILLFTDICTLLQNALYVFIIGLYSRKYDGRPMILVPFISILCHIQYSYLGIVMHKYLNFMNHWTFLPRSRRKMPCYKGNMSISAYFTLPLLYMSQVAQLNNCWNNSFPLPWQSFSPCKGGSLVSYHPVLPIQAIDGCYALTSKPDNIEVKFLIFFCPLKTPYFMNSIYRPWAVRSKSS